MESSFFGLSIGLVMSIVLVYLLIVVNFQSWLDPFIIITALPAALAGIVWMLFLTHTDAQRSGAHRRHHVHGRGDREQHSDDYRSRMNAWKKAWRRCRRRLKPAYPIAAGDYDGAGDDHRHVADGVGPGRRRRAECAAGPRRDRRTSVRDGRDAVFCAGGVQHYSWTADGAAEARSKA